MDAESIRIECEEDGFWLVVKPEDLQEESWRISDPEALYDHVKAAIGPWLYERDMAQPVTLSGADTEWPITVYDTTDPKHPAYHSTHADIWDAREAK